MVVEIWMRLKQSLEISGPLREGVDLRGPPKHAFSNCNSRIFPFKLFLLLTISFSFFKGIILVELKRYVFKIDLIDKNCCKYLN